MENQFKNRIDHRNKFDMKLLRTFTNLRKKLQVRWRLKAFKIKQMLENSNQYDNQRWLPSLRFFFFFLNFINRTRKQFYFRYAVRPIVLAKRYAQIRKLKRKNGHNHLSPQTNFNRQKSIIIWRVCVINPWQSSGRIAISTRVLQNLNQFTLKNHEKLNKIDIWR